MSLDINGYNEAFRAFVDFAKEKEAANDNKAVARIGKNADGSSVLRSISA